MNDLAAKLADGIRPSVVVVGCELELANAVLLAHWSEVHRFDLVLPRRSRTSAVWASAGCAGSSRAIGDDLVPPWVAQGSAHEAAVTSKRWPLARLARRRAALERFILDRAAWQR
ncbi:hypothetical protein [Lysinibacter cavernae]|uniref:hypothetical protein n=1 Tax=Lysinibacter cavernae TaxID=1640652 RepID=UPI001ABAAC82|nr:hypothetical protein [Lysinibacter cavernae]